MVRSLKRHPFVTLGLGLTMGLLVGVGMFAGAVVATGLGKSTSPSMMPEIPLYAAGAHGAEGFAMATGNIDEDSDGLYTLDFLTGDLMCWMFNPRTGTFTGLFTANVLNDLGIPEKGKKPNYAIVTGLVSWRGGVSGPARPGNALVYVADTNTGNFAAYGLFVNRAASGVGGLQKDALRKVAFGKARNLPER